EVPPCVAAVDGLVGQVVVVAAARRLGEVALVVERGGVLGGRLRVEALDPAAVARDVAMALLVDRVRPRRARAARARHRRARHASASAVGRTWSSKRARRSFFENLPTEVLGTSSMNTTSSGVHHLAMRPSR